VPLSDFLYRCPSCGGEPVENVRGTARCRACMTEYRQGRGETLILERRADGKEREVPAAELAATIRSMGGPGPVPTPRSKGSEGEGPPALEARVRFRQAQHEDPIHYEGRLLGFAEQFDAPREGILRLDGEWIQIQAADGTRLRWSLDEIRAVQASSSSVQFAPGDGGVVLLRFPDTSPRRWDDLLRETLQARWHALGRGTILEFQPRIRTQ
jgi:hypothetical protein